MSEPNDSGQPDVSAIRSGTLGHSYPNPSGRSCLAFGSSVLILVLGFATLAISETVGAVVVIAGLGWLVVSLAWFAGSYIRRLRAQKRDLLATPEGAAVERTRRRANSRVAKVVVPGVLTMLVFCVLAATVHPLFGILAAASATGTAVLGARARGQVDQQWNDHDAGAPERT